MFSSLKFRGASTSSSSAHQWTYDVYLSFGDEDTSKNFTRQLYDALERNGLKTFIDDEQLRSGEQIPSTLVKAIEGSRISIVVLSEKYASSAWSLDELTKIVECMETKKQIVVPVLHQKNNIIKSFGKLEERFIHNPEKVERWKAVLRQVSNISGWDLQNAGRYFLSVSYIHCRFFFFYLIIFLIPITYMYLWVCDSIYIEIWDYSVGSLREI